MKWLAGGFAHAWLRWTMALALGAVSGTGCLVQRREQIQPPPAPAALREASLDELLENVRAQQAAIRTLNAVVQIEPSVTSADQDEIVHYRDVRAFLLIRRPAFLRMVGQYPVVKNTAFDLASDGEHFQLFVPSKNRFITGSSKDGKRSKSALENLRPQHILDALLWSGPDPEREQAVREIASEDSHAYYVVHILRRLPGDALLLSRRMWFERMGLTLARLQVFDSDGAVATDVQYSNYGNFNGIPYPRRIEMVRPQDRYGLVLSVEQLRFNEALEDDKFRLERPPGTEWIRLDESSPAEQASVVW